MKSLRFDPCGKHLCKVVLVVVEMVADPQMLLR